MLEPVGSAAAVDVVYSDRQLSVTRTQIPHGLRFSGEIDISNSGAIAESLLKAFAGDGDPHLDLSRLVFCDVSGIRALVTVAENLGPKRRLLLHGLPPEIGRVFHVTGWTGVSGFSLCYCGREPR